MAFSRAVLTTFALHVLIGLTESTVVVSPNRASPPKGNTIRPTCKVTGEAFLGWYDPKGNKIDTTGRKHVETTGSEHTLVIQNVKPLKDGGMYECRGNITKATLEVDVPFTVNPLTTQNLRLNTKDIIKLEAHGFPVPRYEWKKDSVSLNPKAGGRFKVYSNSNGSIVEIANVEVGDEGTYECKISQGVSSRDITIQVHVIDPPTITVQPQSTRELTAGYNTTFRCNATGRPTPTIAWLDQNGRAIDQSDDERFTISNNFTTIIGVKPKVANTTISSGFFTITGVKPEDANGNFTCEAMSPEGTVKSKTARITRVYVLPTLNKVDDLNKNMGDKAVLTCIASGGDPKPIVVWTRNGIVVKNQELNTSQSVITFDEVELRDMGKYVCEAQNGARDENSNPIVVREDTFLDVQSAPILNAQKSVSTLLSYVGSSEPVKVICEFDGNPPPNITMTTGSNGTIVATGQTTAIYEIRKVTEESFGMYFCSATNKHGTKNHTVEVKKAVKPGKPDSLHLSESCVSIYITWTKPVSDGGFPITKYFVQTMDENNKEVSTRTVYPSAKLQYEQREGIKSNKKYTVKVQALNAVGKGETKESSVTTKQFCAPHRPSIIAPLEKTLQTTSIVLKWRRPAADGGDANLRYRVEYTEFRDGKVQGNGTSVSGLTDTQHTVTGLRPGIRYRFRVFAVNRAGESQPAEDNYFVSADALGKGRGHAFSASTVVATACALVAILKISMCV